MALTPHGRIHRSIALLLAVLMPLCCCTMGAVAGNGCCNDPVQVAAAVPSCCQAPAESEQAPADDGCCDDCDCTDKAPGTGFDWTVPVDTIGTPLPPSVTHIPAVISACTPWIGLPPPARPCPATVRGIVILNC